MRKTGLWCLAALVIAGLTCSASAADWIQQNRWTIAGPYASSGCGPGNAFVDSSLMTDMDIDAINPVHGDVAPNAANLKAGAWPLFDTWQHAGTRGIGGGDLVNLNDSIFGSDPNDCYAVGVVYVLNKTGAPLDVVVCSSSDDAIGIVVNDTLVHNNGTACRGDAGGCSDRANATLQDGVNKIAAAAYEAGGGWNYRVQLRLLSDDSIIDDTESPLVAFDSSPTGAFDQFAIKRASADASINGADKLDVSLKGNGLYPGAAGDALVVTERLSSAVTVTNVSNGGVISKPDAVAGGTCDLGGTPVGLFNSVDVGGPAFAGSTVLNGSAYEVTGGGNDIWGGGDQFQFAYKSLIGDFKFTTKITGRDYLPGPNPPSRWGKVGPMARQDCSPASRYYFTHDSSPDSNGTDPDNTRAAGRTTHGGGDTFETGFGNATQHSDWLGIQRIGNTFISLASDNGVNWIPMGMMHWADAPESVLVGLAVTSHAGAAPIKITFDNVTIEGGEGPATADPPRTTTITWNTTVGDVDTGLTYTVTPDPKVTDVINFVGGVTGGDDKGHPAAGPPRQDALVTPGQFFYGHERPGAGPDFTHSFDIGNDIAGQTSFDAESGVYTLYGSGFDLWGDNDSTHWAYREVVGDFDIVAEVVDRNIPVGTAWGRYGLMARADNSTDARYTAIVAHTGVGGIGDNRHHCDYDGGTCGHRFQSHVYHGDRYVGFDNQTDVRNPDREPYRWQRLVGHNQTIYGYGSDDGESWRMIGSMPFYGADPAKPILVGYYTQQHGSNYFNTITKVKIHKFGPLDTGLPILSNDGGEPFEEFIDDFNRVSLGGDWSAQKRDATFIPTIINERLRITQEEGGESTSVFSTFGIDGIDDRIYVFDFDAYMARTNADHPADALNFTVTGDNTLPNRVGYGGGSGAYNGLGRSVVGDLNVGNNSFAVEIDTWSGGGWHPSEGVGLAAKQWALAIDVGNNVNSVAQVNDLGGDPVVPLPDVFAPDGVHFKVQYNRGRISVWINANDGSDPVKAIEADTIPISFGWSDGTATYGWTGATGGAIQIAEVDNFVLSSVECNDIPDVAAISGAPAQVDVGAPINLGSVGSSAGAGDTGTLTYKWEVVSGPGAISGSDSGADVVVNTSAAGDVVVKLTVSDNSGCTGEAAATAEVTVKVAGVVTATWIRGDANGDKTIDISDPVANLDYQFLGGFDPACIPALDSNADGSVDISDPTADLGRLFLGDPLPPTWLTCENFEGCATNCP